MKKLTLSILLLLCLVTFTHAEQKKEEWKLRYNDREKEWVYAPSNWKLKWNWQEKKWQYAPEKSKLEWNWHEKRWEFVPEK